MIEPKPVGHLMSWVVGWARFVSSHSRVCGPIHWVAPPIKLDVRGKMKPPPAQERVDTKYYICSSRKASQSGPQTVGPHAGMEQGAALHWHPSTPTLKTSPPGLHEASEFRNASEVSVKFNGNVANFSILYNPERTQADIHKVLWIQDAHCGMEGAADVSLPVSRGILFVAAGRRGTGST